MKRAQRGMTLVEMVIAATIFAMIMLATVTGLRTFALSYDRLLTKTAYTSEMREVDRFLRAAFRDTISIEGQFEGSAREVRWIAPLDRAGSAGGLQHLRLRYVGGALMLSFAPVDYEGEDDMAPDWGAVVEDYRLLNSVKSLRLSYLSKPDVGWSPRSDDKKAADGESVSNIPRLVRLEIETEVETWPPIIVQLDQHEHGS